MIAHPGETPVLTRKLWHALSINAWGVGRVGREIGFSHDALWRNEALKRAFDPFTALMLVPTALLFTLIAALAAVVSGCSPFVAREVVEANGRKFRVWQTGTVRYPRTLAEAMVISHFAARSYLTLGDCLMVPRGVRLIRRVRHDEVPMIWGVLRGDLSLVGPRMQRKNLSSLKRPADHSPAKPGISGFAQLRTGTSRQQSELAKLDQSIASVAVWFLT